MLPIGIIFLLLALPFSFSTEAISNEKIDQIITQMVNSFKNKLEASSLSKVDIEVIEILLDLIKYRQEQLEEEERQKGHPVYWHLRQGRSPGFQMK